MKKQILKKNTSKQKKCPYFKSLDTVDPSIDSFMGAFYKKHADLMKELEDE